MQPQKRLDLRAIRKDEANLPVRYDDEVEYDQTMPPEKSGWFTRELVIELLKDSNVEAILFNDPLIHN